ncbi:hypothetical protein [Chryseobacterium balustinum]|uniref:hypothetical protein n=1 Tax=Chryseobacterium balustinum TaxID=246 RepID=UPI003CF89F41
MKKNISKVPFVYIVLLCLSYCTKNPEKPVKQIHTSNMRTDSIQTDVPALKNSVVSGEDSLALRVKDYINSQYLKPEDLKIIEPAERKFNLYQIDLNNDGKKEVLVNFFTPYFCGSGGCTLALLDSNLKLINRFTVTRTPITIDSKTENGWKVLWLQDRNTWKKLINKNGKYPSNPSVIENTKEAPETNTIKIFDTNTSKSYSF